MVKTGVGQTLFPLAPHVTKGPKANGCSMMFIMSGRNWSHKSSHKSCLKPPGMEHVEPKHKDKVQGNRTVKD